MPLNSVRRTASGNPMLPIKAARVLRDLYVCRGIPAPGKVVAQHKPVEVPA